MKTVFLSIGMIFFTSCVQHGPPENDPSAGTVAFFRDYAENDGPGAETLPVFLKACRGDHGALREIFSDYDRYGSGDNEAWGDVPDVLLREIGDERFAAYLRQEDRKTAVAAVKWLGPPERALYEDAEERREYPLTAREQERLMEGRLDRRYSRGLQGKE